MKVLVIKKDLGMDKSFHMEFELQFEEDFDMVFLLLMNLVFVPLL